MNGPRELVFFTDRDLGRRFLSVLRGAGVRVEQHDDHFGPETTDEEWIGEIGRRGWIAVTRDARIRYSPLALSVLMESDTQLFVVVGKLTTDMAAETFLKWRDKIASTVHSERGPFIAKIRRDGVHIWLRRKDWRHGRS
jgi:PIN like domain